MSVINGILLIYHHHLKANAPTIKEHVHAFEQHSRFKIWKVNTQLGFPPELKDLRFSVILLHYSLFGLPIIMNDHFLRFIKASESSYKIAFLQDEYRYWPERSEFINSYGIDCVYTLLEPEYFDITYRKRTHVPKIVYNLPGYVSQDLLFSAKKYSKPDSSRTIDVGYRGRRLPYYLGRGSLEKHLIGVEFKKRAVPTGLRVDIETDEIKRIYGKAWPNFLANCKAVLGVEAGVSVFDIDDVVRPQYAKMCKGHPDVSFPDCSFEELYDAILAPHEGKIYYRTISPRHFEAAAFGVCQILFEGKYSGILQPMVHYIPLKKDFSNFDEVLSHFNDAGLRKELTENAYRDLRASGKYSYQHFIENFDEELLALGLSAETSYSDAANIRQSLYKYKLRRYLNIAWTAVRYTEYPGRNLIKPIVKPILKRLNI
jgi:hypothetical protein